MGSVTDGEADMLEELPTRELPTWLTAAGDRLGELPIQAMLEGSVYYPACGVDGDPVKYLGGNFHNFVYVDYGVGRHALRDELETFRPDAPAALKSNIRKPRRLGAMSKTVDNQLIADAQAALDKSIRRRTKQGDTVSIARPLHHEGLPTPRCALTINGQDVKLFYRKATKR